MSEQKRCGKCSACLVVESSKKVLMPNPPFSHADNLTVQTWNKVLKENPCELWDVFSHAVEILKNEMSKDEFIEFGNLLDGDKEGEFLHAVNKVTSKAYPKLFGVKL